MRFAFMNRHTKLPPCSVIPDTLDKVAVGNTAKLAYVKLLKCIIVQGIEDENGVYFMRYPIRELASDMSVSEMTVKRCLRDLENEGLIMRLREMPGRPTLIYVLLPEE